jgi:hypothetical protein
MTLRQFEKTLMENIFPCGYLFLCENVHLQIHMKINLHPIHQSENYQQASLLL